MQKLMLVFICLLLAVPSQARSITVDANGTGDYLTIQAAINDSNDGDTVMVYPGMYYEAVDFSGKDIVLTSTEPNDPLVVDSTIICADSYSALIASDGSILGFTIINHGYRGIDLSDCSPTISHCHIIANDWAIRTYVNYHQPAIVPIIKNNVLRSNWGIHLSSQAYAYGGVDAIIRNNLIISSEPNSGMGIQYRAHQSLPTVSGNIITGFETGISLTYDSLKEERKALITYNDVWGNTYNYSGFDLTGVQGNISADPNFFNPADGDYHLSAGSPCINAGDPNYAAGPNEKDLDGEPRIMDGRIDIGIDEFSLKGPLVGLDIIGPNNVRENYHAQYKAVAYYENGTFRYTTALSSWWIDPNTIADIDANGLLQTGDINSAEYITIYAQYAEGAVVLQAEKAVQISLPQTLYVTAQYGNIQAAVDAAEHNDIVLIEDGTYTGSGNRDIDFHGKQITLRSENGPNMCIIDCNAGASEPHRGFYFHWGEDKDSVIDGLTIINGWASKGGAIYCEGSSPTITNCIITGNSADGYGGGAIYCEGSSPTITNCRITNNYVEGSGGGILCERGGATIANCYIAENTAAQSGGILCCESEVNITDCIFKDNTADDFPGSEIGCEFSSLTISNCTISNYPAYYPAYEDSLLSFQDESSVVMSNCTVSGGNVGIECVFWTNAAITNCTVSSAGLSAIVVDRNSSSSISNCILWSVWQDWEGEKPPYYEQYEIFLEDESSASIIYTDVQGGQGSIYIEEDCTLDWGVGNIDADPCFAKASFWDANGTPEEPWDDFWVDGDYHLKSEGWRWDTQRKVWTWDDVTSRCIDAGNPGSSLGAELLSIPVDPNNEWGENLRINMGVYGGTAEASMPPYDWALLADLTNDGTVNFEDYTAQAIDWLESVSEQPGDLNRDGTVDIYDVALLTEDWLEQTSWYTP